MGMADFHFKHSLSFAVFSIFVFFYLTKVAVAGTPFLPLGLRREKFNHFRVYWHSVGGGSNPTTIQVGGANSTQDSATRFGGIAVFDDALTLGPESSSQLVGRAQGFYASAGMNEIAILTTANIVFTTGKFNGSTIGIMGRNTVLSEVREMAVVGGTGRLRFARGYVETRTHGFNITAVEATAEHNIYVYHY